MNIKTSPSVEIVSFSNRHFAASFYAFPAFQDINKYPMLFFFVAELNGRADKLKIIREDHSTLIVNNKSRHRAPDGGKFTQLRCASSSEELLAFR